MCSGEYFVTLTIPHIWGVDNLIIFVSAADYSLINDRFDRRRLTIKIYTAGIAVYAGVYLLFISGVNDVIPYMLLMILNYRWRLL